MAGGVFRHDGRGCHVTGDGRISRRRGEFVRGRGARGCYAANDTKDPGGLRPRLARRRRLLPCRRRQTPRDSRPRPAGCEKINRADWRPIRNSAKRCCGRVLTTACRIASHRPRHRPLPPVRCHTIRCLAECCGKCNTANGKRHRGACPSGVMTEELRTGEEKTVASPTWGGTSLSLRRAW